MKTNYKKLSLALLVSSLAMSQARCSGLDIQEIGQATSKPLVTEDASQIHLVGSVRENDENAQWMFETIFSETERTEDLKKKFRALVYGEGDLNQNCVAVYKSLKQGIFGQESKFSKRSGGLASIHGRELKVTVENTNAFDWFRIFKLCREQEQVPDEAIVELHDFLSLIQKQDTPALLQANKVQTFFVKYPCGKENKFAEISGALLELTKLVFITTKEEDELYGSVDVRTLRALQAIPVTLLITSEAISRKVEAIKTALFPLVQKRYELVETLLVLKRLG
jgi:hypothetical protein